MAIVLIVQDELATADTIAEVLEQEGFIVVRSPTSNVDAVEMAQRLRADLRSRSSVGIEARALEVGDLVVDLLTRAVQRGSLPIELAPREFDLLVYLVKHAGQVVDRKTLFEAVWRHRHDGLSNVVEVHIARLRRKLQARGAKPMIYTVRRVGYLLTDSQT